MSTPTSLILAGWLVWTLAACTGTPPKPVLPDGLHRVPVNHLPPVPDSPAAVQSPDSPALRGAGGRS